ncbi:MAG: ABC transporter substrate-binding protein [Spirochaetes bacterium]|nr:ABC transporter substrate-binding protein [Spirochaetota bacterium]
MKRIYLLIILLLTFSSGCTEGTDPSLLKGHDIPAVQPERIISLAPAITEELYLLGAQNILIANTYYCKRPDDAVKKEKIGNLKNFDIELILELKPDLILCTMLANRNKTTKLKQLGIKVVEFPPPTSFDEICENFLNLGKTIGKKEKAEEIISDIRGRIDVIKNRTAKLPSKKIFMQIGANPLVTVHRDYFINDYIKYSGGINIAGNAASNRYNRENVLLGNPDVIVIVNMGIASDEEKKLWEKYTTITAVRNKDIYVVDSDVFCNPTISTFFESLKILTGFLHPELEI